MFETREFLEYARFLLFTFFAVKTACVLKRLLAPSRGQQPWSLRLCREDTYYQLPC